LKAQKSLCRVKTVLPLVPFLVFFGNMRQREAAIIIHSLLLQLEAKGERSRRGWFYFNRDSLRA